MNKENVRLNAKSSCIAVIIPAYNEADNIRGSFQEISEVLMGLDLDYEILYVDDGSMDNTWQEIIALSQSKKNVRGIRFSRNFGKEAAIYAGLNEIYGRCECCVVMDCDLQHPPKTIKGMYDLWKNDGCEVVFGVKRSRGKEGWMHGFFAGIFYRVISWAVGFDLKNASDFVLLDKKAVAALIGIPEKKTFFRAMARWVGFKSASCEFDVAKRAYGKSKWSNKTLIKYAVSNITSFTGMPMQMVTVMGAVMFLVFFIFSAVTILQKMSGQAVDGFTTVIVLEGFVGSMIMMSNGIIGYYLTKVFEEVKGRPKYIIMERIEMNMEMKQE